MEASTELRTECQTGRSSAKFGLVLTTFESASYGIHLTNSRRISYFCNDEGGGGSRCYALNSLEIRYLTFPGPLKSASFSSFSARNSGVPYA